MKRAIFAGLVCFVLACGGSTPFVDGGLAAPDSFSVSSPDLTIGPGQEKTFCYYTKLTNPQPFGVRRFESTMSPGSHHLIVFSLKSEARPLGTLEECSFPRGGFGSSRTIPVWLYAAQSPEASIDLPAGVGTTVYFTVPTHAVPTKAGPTTTGPTTTGPTKAE